DAGPAAELRAVTPLVRAIGGHEPGEIHAGDAGKLACVLHGHVRIGIPGHDAAGLRAFLTQDAGELARVDVGDADGVGRPQELAEVALGPPAARDDRAVTDDHAGGVDARRLHVLAVRTRVADV